MTTDLAAAGLSQLREAEALIRAAGESFYDVAGRELMRVRDDELFRFDGFDSWDDYLNRRVKERFGIGREHVFTLIACTQIREKMPEVESGAPDSTSWSQRALLEFGRLAPRDERHPNYYDFNRLDPSQVAAVVHKVIDYCKQENKEPAAPIVRRFVNEAIGPNVAPQPAGSGAGGSSGSREERPELQQYLTDLTAYLETEVDKLTTVPEDAMREFGKEHPNVVKRSLAAVTDLADLLREAQA